MRYPAVEAWSRRSSPLHRLDPGAKLAPLAVLLVTLATAHRSLIVLAGVYLSLLLAAVFTARLPAGGILARSALVLPFSGIFAILTWLAGDPVRASELVLKSYVSAMAVLLLASTTPLPALFRRLETIGIPGFLLTVTQFVYRYLFVIAGEAQHILMAAAARGELTFQAASGSLAVLFARSYARAGDIHRAMLARGFDGHFVPLAPQRFTTRDGLAAVVLAALPVLARIAVERLA